MRIGISLLLVVVCGLVYGDQTGRVYEADYALVDIKGCYFINGRADVQKYMDKVFKDEWFKKRYKLKKPAIIRHDDNNRVTSTIMPNQRGTIAVPDRGCFNFNVLHEIAHHIDPSSAHEKNFVKLYLILVDHYINPSAGNELRKSYKRLGVNF